MMTTSMMMRMTRMMMRMTTMIMIVMMITHSCAALVPG